MTAVKIFFCYAQEDERFRQELEKHLSGLRRSKFITTWYDRQIQADINWQQEIDSHIESADIILPIISPDFSDSDYCFGAEMKRALERHSAEEVYVIPILARPVDWEALPFKNLEILPTTGRAVSTLPNSDDAFLNITEGIRSVVAKISGPLPLKNTGESSEYSHPVPGKQDIANLLEVRKNNKHSTVLLLGSRTGKLFRSTLFYENLQLFSKHNFNQLSRLEQFRECFRLLTQGVFSETDMYSLLKVSLHNDGNVEADVALAALIKHGYFHEIITTNIDDNLEEALLTVDMKEGREFEVMILPHKATQVENNLPYRIIKAFGDLTTREFVLGQPSYLENNQSFRNLLQNLLARDVLAIGIDPVWDQEMLRIIPTKGGALWFINEEGISEKSLVSTIVKSRRAINIIGAEGQYEYFINSLYRLLYGNISPNYPFVRSQMPQDIEYQIEQIERLKVLLSGINDQLKLLQNDNRTFFGEIQEIRKKLEQIEKKQH